MKNLMRFFVLISMMLITLLLAVQASASELPAISADVNFDGSVNAIDLLTVKKVLVGLADSFEAADITCDGKINAKDALFVTKVIKGEIKLDNIVSLTCYSVDRHTYQNFLSDMIFENISEGEGIWGIERITFIPGSTNDLCYEDLISGYSITGQYDDGLGFRLGSYYHWPVYKAEVEVLSDPVKLRNLFIEHGIELPRYPTTVCLIDTAGWVPVYLVKCGNVNYFVENVLSWEYPYESTYKIYSTDDFIEYAKDKKGTLVINGVQVEDEHAVANSQYCLVSITNLLKGMGAEIDWESTTNADITYNGKKFVIERDTMGRTSFYEVGGDQDYFMLVGGTPVWEFLDFDILIDDEHIGYVVAALVNNGVYNYRFLDYDYESDIINIITNIKR